MHRAWRIINAVTLFAALNMVNGRMPSRRLLLYGYQWFVLSPYGELPIALHAQRKYRLARERITSIIAKMTGEKSQERAMAS